MCKENVRFLLLLSPIQNTKFRNPDPVRGNFSLFGIAVALFFRKIHIPSLVNGRKSSQNSATSIPTGSGFLKLQLFVTDEHE